MEILQPFRIDKLMVEKQARYIGKDGAVVTDAFAFFIGGLDGSTNKRLEDFVDTIQRFAAAGTAGYQSNHVSHQKKTVQSRRQSIQVPIVPASRTGDVL